MPSKPCLPPPRHTPGHGNIFHYSTISTFLLSTHTGHFYNRCTDLTVGVPLAGTPPVSRTSRSPSDSLSRRSNRLPVAPDSPRVLRHQHFLPEQISTGSSIGSPCCSIVGSLGSSSSSFRTSSILILMFSIMIVLRELVVTALPRASISFS